MIELVTQRAVRGIFSYQVREAFCEPNINECEDVTMLQFLEKLRFLEKLLAFLWRAEVSMQKFYSNGTLGKNSVFCLIDTPKCPTADFRHNTIVANLFPNE